MQDLSLSLVQPNPKWHKVEDNLAHYTAMFSSQSLTTDIVLLPEMFTTGFTMESAKFAEPMQGRTHSWMQEQAMKLDAVISGSIIIEENGNYFNRFLWVETNGNTTHYDKRHLFRMADENNFYTQGKKLVGIKYKGWNLRPLICYDLRFPVWARNSAKDDGFAYDILLFVANWPQARIAAWTSLLQARAIENYAYCLGVNRVGEDKKGIIYNGQSVAFDPKGNKLCSLKNAEIIQTVVLNYEELAEYRQKFPVFLDADNYEVDI